MKLGRRSRNRPPKPKAERVVAPDMPSFETADFDDPESHAVWALAGLPHMKGAPLGMPMFMLRAISKRLWDCGFRFHPELRRIKYRPPHTGQGVGMLSAAGEWVPVDEPDPVELEPAEALAEALAQLPGGVRKSVTNALGVPDAVVDDGLVPYRRADGTVVRVTPAQARAWRNAKNARKGEAS